MTGEVYRTASGAIIVAAGGGIPYLHAGAGSAPTLTSVSPPSGTTAGGTLLTLTGSHFTGATAVAGSGGSFTVVNDTSITFTAPAHAAGAISVSVTNATGTSGTQTFTYTAPATGAKPKWSSVTPWVVPSAAGTTITINGSGFTGATVMDVGTNVGVVGGTTVVSDTQLTFAKPASGPGYYPYAFFIRNANGDSDRFGLITGLTSSTTCIDNNLSQYLAGASMTIYGYSYPFGSLTSLQIKRAADNVVVDTHVFNASAVDGSWSITFTAPTVGQYLLHSNTSTSGSDFWTITPFTTVSTFTAPFITAFAPFAKVPGMAALITIGGANFTGATSINFGPVSVTNHTVVSDAVITLPAAPDQAFGPVNVTVTGASGEVSNSVAFQYLHAIVEPVPVSVGGAAPVVSSRWKGPWAAVNAPKSGQFTSIIIDPVHGNGTGTGSDGTSSNLWNSFEFLNPASLGYPKLADGGTVNIRAGTFTAGPYARGFVGDFPGGINIVGVGADQVTLLNFGTGPASDKAMTLWHCNTYIYGLNFQMGGTDEQTQGYGAIRFYNTPIENGSATAHYIHIEKCRFNQCEEAMTSDTGWTTGGENWCLYIKNCDFSYLIPDCYNTDILSHEVYSGAQQFWETCNSYGPKYGTTHKGRSPSMTIVGCWTRRGLNRWIDFPESGVFQAWNSTFTEMTPQYGSPGNRDTDMHVFEYCSSTPNLTVTPTSPLFNNCDLWFSRGVDVSTGGTSGEDWMTPVAINFVGCRAHWANPSGGVPPKIWCIDPADANAGIGPHHDERIVGIPLSPPGALETLPAAPAPRTP